jgi:hypothetical protein
VLWVLWSCGMGLYNTLHSCPCPTHCTIPPSTAMSSKRKWDQAAPEEEFKDDPELPAKLAKVDEGKNASTAAAAAAAIAAKIAAQYSNATAGGATGLLGPKDIHDGEFTQDIDINDLRNRYMLTKGSTQQQVRHSSPIHNGHISQTLLSTFF